MPLSLTKKQITIFSILIFIFLSGLSYFLFFTLQPLKKEMSNIEIQIENEKQIHEENQKKIEELKGQTGIKTTGLQKKLPVESLLEQFILDLEKAEVVSGSLITTMSFDEGPFEITEEEQNLVEEYQGEIKKRNDDAKELNEKATNEAPNNEEQQTNEETKTVEPLPGMYRITANLSIDSPDYFSMLTFLNTIEQLERITKIDQLTFQGYTESVAVMPKEKEEKLTYTLTISTFYYPKLEELIPDLPQLQIPNPSNKENPISLYGQLNSTNFERIYSTNDYHIKEHKVKQGDTLYGISLQYYKSRKGEEIIRRANNLDGNKIIIGTTLKIPIPK